LKWSEGKRGELVITSLQREAFPLVRYLSKDITTYYGFKECECGLTHPTISADIDREDYMTKIRGVTVFPSNIEFLLNKHDELAGKCQIVVDKRTPRHETILKAETTVSMPTNVQETLKQEIIDEIKTRIGIALNKVEFIPQGTLENKFKKIITIL